MNKRIKYALAALVIAVSALFPGMASGAEGISVYIDGAKVAIYEALPEIKEERCFVPIRFISESMGYYVSYDDKTKTVTIANIFSHVIGDSYITKSNGVVLDFDVASYIKDSRAMVSIRLFAEALGSAVYWDAECKNVLISTKRSGGAVAAVISAAHIHSGEAYTMSDKTFSSEAEGILALVDKTRAEIVNSELTCSAKAGDSPSTSIHGSAVAVSGGSVLDVKMTEIKSSGAPALGIQGSGTRVAASQLTIEHSAPSPAVIALENAELEADNLTVNSQNGAGLTIISSAARLSGSIIQSRGAALYNAGSLNAEKLTLDSSEEAALAFAETATAVLKDCKLSGVNAVSAAAAETFSLTASGGEMRANGAVMTADGSKGSIALNSVKLSSETNTFAELAKCEVALSASGTRIDGNIVLKGSSLTISLKSGASLSGAVSLDADSSVNLTLDKSSRLVLNASLTLEGFENEDMSMLNINSNGFDIYYNNEKCPALGSKTYELPGGGKLMPSDS